MLEPPHLLLGRGDLPTPLQSSQRPVGRQQELEKRLGESPLPGSGRLEVGGARTQFPGAAAPQRSRPWPALPPSCAVNRAGRGENAAAPPARAHSSSVGARALWLARRALRERSEQSPIVLRECWGVTLKSSCSLAQSGATFGPMGAARYGGAEPGSLPLPHLAALRPGPSCSAEEPALHTTHVGGGEGQNRQPQAWLGSCSTGFARL